MPARAARRSSAWESPLEAKGCADGRAGKAHILQQSVFLEIVVDGAIAGEQFAPLERVADSHKNLRSQRGGAGACVQVIRDEPATAAELQAAANTDDDIPQVLPL